MMYGESPFDGNSQMEYKLMITTMRPYYARTIYIPEEEDSEIEQDLLEGLFKKNPDQRLGCQPGQEEDIKSHAFFQSIDWETLERREMNPPYRPVVYTTFLSLPLLSQFSLGFLG